MTRGLLVLVLAGLGLAACSHRTVYSFGPPIKPADFESLVKGETTIKQIHDLWGDPVDIVAGTDEKILTYETGEAEEVGPNLNRRVLMVKIALDSKDVLKDFSLETHYSEHPLPRMPKPWSDKGPRVQD